MIDRKVLFVEKIQKHLAPEFENIHFEEPPKLEGQSSFDLAIPCFVWAKEKKQSPVELAKIVAEKIKELDFVDEVQSVKAFVNLRIKPEEISLALSKRAEDPFGDHRHFFEGQRVVIEFSSPNIAKPFSVGHMRSTNIGASLSRIFQTLGAEVVRINHLGDWGTNFGKLICAYKRFGSADFVRGDPINNLSQLYVRFHEEEKNDPALMDEAREWFTKLESGDDEARELWNWFKDVSYHEFKKTYDRLGVEFDYVTGESFYSELMPKTITQLEEANLLKESEGAKIVDLESFGLPPCLILKKDGSTLYATRDIATVEYRMETFRPSRLIYVVGGEQKLHFQQVFKVLELLGHDWRKYFQHVDFGLIRFNDEKMSTRKGNVVLLENVLDTAEQKVMELVADKEELSADEKSEIAKKVGIGAVLFFDLKAKRTKTMQFKWEDILSFEGDAGPYLQYSVVRLNSVIEKAQKEGFEAGEAIASISTEEERRLALRLLNFPSALIAAARECEPSSISNELLDLAAAANRFYMNVRVLKGEESLIPGRLKLIQQAKACIEEGLALLGIECPQKM